MKLPTPRTLREASRGDGWAATLLRVMALILFLYGFLVSIGMLGKAFRLFSGGFVGDLIQSASNPLLGLFVGLLTTALVQSSSTTTSLVVALVGGGAMPVATAIPVVMGANIGTTVTNVLVSLSHLTRSREFQRAFTASTVHDFFNVFAVVLLFPVQLATGFLGRASQALAELFQQVGGLTFASPLKLITGPAVTLAADVFGGHPWMLVVFSLAVMFGSLRYLVKTLKGLVLKKAQALFDLVIFRNAGRAMLFGLALTFLVQSSSITTSLVVPLAGAGILSLTQIFPYTLGANVGTTITCILAALTVGEITALTVAFAHLLFNVMGIALIWPIRSIRNVPPNLARWLGAVAARNRWIPFIFILTCFYLVPFLLILVLR